ncbi:hypothetical protein [Stenotrophomonas maltophilia]|uniref:hypothetical protein n=1 Tax=Stenotrophomonas maltophilia TaxID=40324 RepID=UPI001FA708E5|nr:hypothetical protein [Stenotrophomonas maltophilia]
MNIKNVDAWVRESAWRRAVGSAICLWVAAVVGAAILQANDDYLELYSKTMLTLLLVGVPLALASLVYAIRLIGWRLMKRLAIAVAIVAIIVIALAYLQHLNTERQREEAWKSLPPEQQHKIDGIQERNPALADHLLLEGFDELAEQLEQNRRDRIQHTLGRNRGELDGEVVTVPGNSK